MASDRTPVDVERLEALLEKVRSPSGKRGSWDGPTETLTAMMASYNDLPALLAEVKAGRALRHFLSASADVQINGRLPECPWCGAWLENGHEGDCQLMAALAAYDAARGTA